MKTHWAAFVSSMPSDDETVTLNRFAGGLFLAGGALGLLTLVLPHPASFDNGALYGNSIGAMGFGALILLLAGQLPRWFPYLALAVGTVLVTRAIYYSHEPNGYYAFFYLWVVFYVFYFFGRLWGAIQMLFLGGAYAWVLLEIDASTPLSRWLMVIVSMAGAGLLLELLAQRTREREAEATRQAQALEAVGSVAHELALRTTTESAAPAICEAAAEVTGAAGASLWEPTADGAGLEASAATEPQMVGTKVLLVGAPSGAIRAFNTARPFFIADAPESGELDPRIAERYGVASVHFQPIMRDASPIGVLAIYWTKPTGALHEGIEEVIALLAAEASVAIERTEMLSRLERAARTDDLTGLPNRRAWDEHLGREIARANRLQAPLCVAMLDLDHFKEYNDRFGHQAGDRFLKEAASAWQERTREADFIARYGGEEFAITLLDCRLGEAAELLDALRDATPEGASSSAGLALWDAEESADELVARDDRALYEAKRRGRDRVISSR
ncbi:MAG: GGDEF domain-containing protein [Solirubrobacterales bacterium]